MVTFFLSVAILVLGLSPGGNPAEATSLESSEQIAAKCPRIYMESPQFPEQKPSNLACALMAMMIEC
jgi:hypothetical protein